MKVKKLDYCIPLIIPFSGDFTLNSQKRNIFNSIKEDINDSIMNSLSEYDYEIDNIPANKLGDVLNIDFNDSGFINMERENISVFHSACFYSLESLCIQGKPKRRDISHVIKMVDHYFTDKYFHIFELISQAKREEQINEIIKEQFNAFINEISSVGIIAKIGHGNKQRVYSINAELYKSFYEEALVNLSVEEFKEEKHPILQ